VRGAGLDGLRDGDSRGKGNRPEAGEAGQLDGPVSRGGTTRGPVRQIVEAREVENLPRLWRRMGWNVWCGGMARRNGRSGSSRDGPFRPPVWAYAVDGVQ